jgi:PIN domain nuclease of toxin-antitoxin system
MDFLNQKKWNRDETLAVFNVPKMEVGVWDDINFAIAKVQAREFWLKNLIPKMKLITWIFWSQLFEKINGGRVWAEFDYSGIEALQDEFNEKVKVARTLWEIGYPMNQVNDRLNLGMPENSWQNTAFLPVNMQTLAVDTDGKPLVVPNTSNPGQDPITPSGTGATDESREGEKVALAPPPGSAPNPGQAATSTGNKEYVTLLTRKMKSFFYHQRTRQLKLLEKTGVGVLASSNEYDKFVKALSNITDTSTLEGLPEYINKKVLEIVCLNVDDKLRMSNEVKELYNGIEKLLPAIAEQQDLLMPAPAKANILTANLEKEMVEATLT